LQDPPEVIPELVSAWRSGAEVVRAVRRSRQETGIRRVGFDLFHAVFGSLTDIKIEGNSGTFGLLGRPALEAFARLPERHRFFPGLRAWIGFATADVAYDRQERAAGKPKQTFRRLVRYAVDGFFSFSYLPLRVLTYAGSWSARSASPSASISSPSGCWGSRRRRPASRPSSRSSPSSAGSSSSESACSASTWAGSTTRSSSGRST
jgi:hypothetical protein